MHSLFRIDKSLLPDETQDREVVVLPHFEEMLKLQNDEIPEPQEISEDDFFKEDSFSNYGDDGEETHVGAENEQTEEIDELENCDDIEVIEDEITKKQNLLHQLKEEIEDAMRKKEQILNEANTQAETLKNEASNIGYEEGYAKGVADGKQKAEEQIEYEKKEFEITLSKLLEARDSMYAHVEEGVVDLSASIAQKIIDIEINKNDVVYKQLVRRTLTMLKNQSNVVLHVNKADYHKYFEGINKEFLLELKQADITVKHNISLKDHEILVTTDYGNVNAGIKTQLKQIENLLKNS